MLEPNLPDEPSNNIELFFKKTPYINYFLDFGILQFL